MFDMTSNVLEIKKIKAYNSFSRCIIEVESLTLNMFGMFIKFVDYTTSTN